MEELRQLARREGLAVGEWVRRALRAARAGQPMREPSVKLKAVREAARCSFPTADVRQMLEEIERGYEH
jgi:hypothetical protein